MKKKARATDTLSLSFLDAITCGFGAVILLLVIVKIFEPVRLEESERDLLGLLARHQQELEEIVGQTEQVTRERITAAEAVEEESDQIARLRSELQRISTTLLAAENDAAAAARIADSLERAKQSLTEEMRRLFENSRPAIDEYKIGGIPVDSEYVVFIIDTSGSMQQFAWDRVQQQIRDTLEVYPTVKGMQVINDEGEYMFRSYRGEWIPDTPGRRDAIIDALKNWRAFSDSSPREGILEAIETYYDPDKRISLYVYSDDFSQGSINAVVREVDRRNRLDADGNRRVRIHAVAFPTIYEATGTLYSSADFATLMRALCQRNGGTFVALPMRRDM